MLEDQEQLVLYMFLGGREMTEFCDWQGYKVSQSDNVFTICSRWHMSGIPVFSADCDYTTMLISAIQFINGTGIEIKNISSQLNIDSSVIKIATDVDVSQDLQQWQVYCFGDATFSISQSNIEKIVIPNELNQIDNDRYQSIIDAWTMELQESNVSQGAYISSQQYLESLDTRLNLIAQSDKGVIWPPRQLDDTGIKISDANLKLSNHATIESWTKLSPAGAPSEFSLRAPILGGISTALVKFNEGPRGVFLLVDDEENQIEIGMICEFVVRRIYAQEGQIRYGTKVRISPN